METQGNIVTMLLVPAAPHAVWLLLDPLLDHSSAFSPAGRPKNREL